MDCGMIRGKKNRWQVIWKENTHDVYVKDADAVFFPTVEYVGKAETPREALSKADAHINFN